MIDAITAAGGQVQGYDPQALHEAARIFAGQQGIALMSKRDDTLINADALVICTEWKEFRAVDFDALATTLRFPVLIDGRNLFDPEQVRKAGLRYFAVGRGDSVTGHDASPAG